MSWTIDFCEIERKIKVKVDKELNEDQKAVESVITHFIAANEEELKINNELLLPVSAFSMTGTYSVYISDTSAKGMEAKYQKMLKSLITDDSGDLEEVANSSSAEMNTNERLFAEHNVSVNAQAGLKYHTTNNIPFNKLCPAETVYRLREQDEEYVATLADSLEASNSPVLTSMLTVLETDGMFQIIDGNHRYAAMKKIQKRKPTWYNEVTATIYKHLNEAEALELACCRNADNDIILKMSDFQVVETLRKLHAAEDTRSESMLETAYRIFKANTRRKRQQLTAHSHLSGFDEQSYMVIKEELKNGRVKSSTFACLRTLTAQQRYEVLEAYRLSGFKKSVLEQKAGIEKVPTDYPIHLEVGNYISITKKGSRIKGSTLIYKNMPMDVEEFKLCMTEGLKHVFLRRLHDTSDEERTSESNQNPKSSSSSQLRSAGCISEANEITPNETRPGADSQESKTGAKKRKSQSPGTEAQEVQQKTQKKANGIASKKTCPGVHSHEIQAKTDKKSTSESIQNTQASSTSQLGFIGQILKANKPNSKRKSPETDSQEVQRKTDKESTTSESIQNTKASLTGQLGIARQISEANEIMSTKKSQGAHEVQRKTANKPNLKRKSPGTDSQEVQRKTDKENTTSESIQNTKARSTGQLGIAGQTSEANEIISTKKIQGAHEVERKTASKRKTKSPGTDSEEIKQKKTADRITTTKQSQGADSNEIQNKTVLRRAPTVISKGEYVVIKCPSKAKEQDKEVPWVGIIEKVTQSNIKLRWIEYNRGTWQPGGTDNIPRSNVLAKLNPRSSADIPAEVWDISGLARPDATETLE